MITTRFSIAAVGDLVPSRRIQVPSSGAFAETVGLLRKADVTFGDLEMPLSDRGAAREKFIAFHAQPAIVDDLANLGFNVLSLANNHAFDYGPDAMGDTITGLERVGIQHVGAGRDLQTAEASVRVNLNGARVGVIAWTCLLPAGAAAGEQRPGLAPLHVNSSYEVNALTQLEEPGNPPRVRTWVEERDLEHAVGQVHRLRTEVDFLAVSAHVGFGAGEELAEYEQPLCRAFIDAGADIVLGNHVHAIHGIELYKGKVILYSPGNFIAQQPREGATPEILALYDDMSKDGFLAWIEVDTDGTYSTRIVPTVTNAEGLPEVAHASDAQRIAERISRLSQRLATEVVTDGDQMVVRSQVPAAGRPVGS
jgi:poly-gamma-glutamate capsule biosynthesis protein CapA/YwtB (metallophosphatase superfamily)